MKRACLYLLVSVSLLWQSCSAMRGSVVKECNPLNYGLLQAKTGEERYWALLRCHQDALKYNADISYSGIDAIDIVIPANATPIPLTDKVDFCRATIRVTNNQKAQYLFQKIGALEEISVTGKDIDKGYYKVNKVLKDGTKVLVVEDSNPWVEQRIGYTERVIRRDIVLVRNGKAQNTTVAEYDTPSTKPYVRYFTVNAPEVCFSNLNFVRTASSTQKTYLVKFENQYNVKMSIVSIETPDDPNIFGDVAITGFNVCGLSLKYITINGTYSQSNKYGYGIHLNNVYNLQVEGMRSSSKWGVFGNFNVNKATLVNCDINRFDIHCYGRDVKAIGCHFKKFYNQFSSVYGEISFEDCTFTAFAPVLIESSYNAYTPFDLSFRNCIFNMDASHNYILTLMNPPKTSNPREELSKKNIPNISLIDCEINVPEKVKNWYIVDTGKIDDDELMYNISDVTAKRITVKGGNPQMSVFNEEVKTAKKVRVSVK